MPKVRRHHNNDGRAMKKLGHVYEENKKIAERLGIPFGQKGESNGNEKDESSCIKQ